MMESSVADDGVLAFADHAAEAALRGVILEQMGQHGGAGQIVDGDDFVTLGVEHLAESKTADAAETIDSNFHHEKDLLTHLQ